MGFVYANLIGIFELRSAMNNSKNKLLIHTLVILGIMLPLQHAVSAELDFVKEGLNSSFRFNNPNVENACGCGESFGLKISEEN